MPTEIIEAPVTRRLYEAMFLLSQSVAADLNAAVENITEIVTRAGGDIIAISKWDERRLAYEIDKQKRGCYILVYIKGPGEVPGNIEREINLTDTIMRALIVRADHMSDDQAIATDDREGLAAEARLRSDKSATEEKKSGVRLGAPEPEAAPEADSEGSESAEPAAEAEAPAEGEATEADKPEA